MVNPVGPQDEPTRIPEAIPRNPPRIRPKRGRKSLREPRINLTSNDIQKAAQMLNQIKTRFGAHAEDLTENLLKTVVDPFTLAKIEAALETPGTPEPPTPQSSI